MRERGFGPIEIEYCAVTEQAGDCGNDQLIVQLFNATQMGNSIFLKYPWNQEICSYAPHLLKYLKTPPLNLVFTPHPTQCFKY